MRISIDTWAIESFEVASKATILRTQLMQRLARTYAAEVIRNTLKLLRVPFLAGETTGTRKLSLKEIAKRAKKKKIIVVFPNLFWNYRWQRPQQLFSQAEKAGYTVLFLSLCTIGVKKEIRDIFEAGETVTCKALSTNVFEVALPSYKDLFILRDDITAEDMNNMRLGVAYVVASLAERWRQEQPEVTFVVEHPYWEPLATSLAKRYKGKLIFDLIDNHSGFDQFSELAIKNERNLLRSADTVVATSLFLKQYALEHNPNVVVIRNGADYSHFAKSNKNGKLEPLAKKPIIGYFGAVNKWFDMELISSLALMHPEWNFVFIGTVRTDDVNLVEDKKNIYLLGEKSYAELPGYLAYFDVCIIPFKINALTLATNPVKFYEYMSAGKPVVSSALPELSQFCQYCYIAGDERDFEKALKSALQEQNRAGYAKLIKRRQAIAKRNTWEKRWERFEALLT